MAKIFITLSMLFLFFGCSKVGQTPTSNQKTGNNYHASLLVDTPAIFDATGNIVKPDYIKSQKYLILYFSASWCGPCHRFNPTFIKWYNENGGKKDFEVILVGSDKDTEGVKDYMKKSEFPWLAFEMQGEKFIEIKKKFGGKGIPCVAVLDENDNLVAHSYVNGEYVGPLEPLNKYLELIKKN